MMKCRLLVLDHPGTTLNIAMAANVPTVCFWRKEFFPLADQARPFFSLLEDAGILIHDPVGAAEKINALYEDIESWWNDAKRQLARNRWINEYACVNKYWRLEWVKFFGNYIHSPHMYDNPKNAPASGQ